MLVGLCMVCNVDNIVYMYVCVVMEGGRHSFILSTLGSYKEALLPLVLENSHKYTSTCMSMQYFCMFIFMQSTQCSVCVLGE